MRFTYEGKDFWIKFQHEQFISTDDAGIVWVYPQFIEGTDNAYARGRTLCQICTGPKDNEVIVAEGWAHCSIWDQFDKETGRQLSLSRAVGQGIKHAIFLKKDFRVITAAYYDRKTPQSVRT